MMDFLMCNFQIGMKRVGAGALLAIMTVNKAFGVDPIGRTTEILSKFAVQEKKRSIKVGDWIDEYNTLHDDKVAGVEARNSSYTTLVNAYYELATLFYEWGWGQSFHFAYQLKGETFQTAIARHEYYLAGRLGVKQGDKVLDVGCGIGGPMRNIARFTRANITGVTLNEVRDYVLFFVHSQSISVCLSFCLFVRLFACLFACL
jgi:Mycolic acid cyclopropane synthetase